MQNETAHLFVFGLISLQRILKERHSLHWEVLSWKIDKNAQNGASCHFDWKCTESCINRADQKRIRKRRPRQTKLSITSDIHIPRKCVSQDQTRKVRQKSTSRAFSCRAPESSEERQAEVRGRLIPTQFFKGYTLHLFAFLQTNNSSWNYLKYPEKNLKNDHFLWI